MSGNEEQFQKAMNKGHSAAWDQNWADAAAFYQQALDEFPDHPKALTSLALALYEMQDFDGALKQYRRASQVTPNDPLPLGKVAELQERLGNLDSATKIYMDVAELYARSRDVEKAIENWSRVVSLNPNHIQAHSRLALVFERQGRKPQAVAEYIAIASLLQNNNDIARAVQAAERALQIMPESNEAKQALSMLKSGRLLPKPRRPRGVTGPLMMAQVRQLESPKPDTVNPRMDPVQEARQKSLTMLAGLLFEQGVEESPVQARSGIQSLLRGASVLSHHTVDYTKINLHLSQTIDMQSHGMDAEAISELERAIASGLDHGAAYFDLGLLYKNAERLESAIRNLERAVKHASFTLAARLLLGQIFVRMNRLQEAAVEYLEALKQADAETAPPAQADVLAQLYEPIIESYTQQSNEKLQGRLCKNIDELLMRPDWRVQLKTARMQLPAQAKGAPPMPLAEVFTEGSSSQVVDSLARINAMARFGKLRTAMEEAYHALLFAPTYLPLHITIADLLIQENRIEDAVTKYSVIAQTYNVRGETARAIALLHRIIELSPMNMEARNRMIELLSAHGQTEEALSEYMHLADMYYNVADLSAARQTYTHALRYAQSTNVSRAWKIKILHRLADIDLQSLDWRQAVRVYEQIRTLEPEDSKARTMLFELNLRLAQPAQAQAELDNYIAYLVGNHGEARAFEYLKELSQEHEDQPIIHRSLAVLYGKVGRQAEAIHELERASELLIESGDKNGAIQAVMAILALNPPNASQYQQQLANLRA